MGVQLRSRSRDKTAKWGMAHENFSSSEESTHEQIQGENHDYFFFDNRGIVHKEFVPPRQTVNHAFYKDVLERLRKRVQRVRRDIADDWVQQHNNAPAHTPLSIREFLVKKNIPVLPHPPYSPDLAPCNFCLFPKLKSKLKGHFGTMENIQKIVTDELNTFTKNDFQYCYDHWKKRWNHCVTSQGSYFEGHNL